MPDSRTDFYIHRVYVYAVLNAVIDGVETTAIVFGVKLTLSVAGQPTSSLANTFSYNPYTITRTILVFYFQRVLLTATLKSSRPASRASLKLKCMAAVEHHRRLKALNFL